MVKSAGDGAKPECGEDPGDGDPVAGAGADDRYGELVAAGELVGQGASEAEDASCGGQIGDGAECADPFFGPTGLGS